MKIINKSNENIMILEFLKGELLSNKFNKKLVETIHLLNLKEQIICNGSADSEKENELRKRIMAHYKGYPNRELFNNFPKIIKWDFVRFDKSDIENIYYINYDYWNELSNNTAKPTVAAGNINAGVEIFDVSNQPFIDGIEMLKYKKFPPVILITCNNQECLIIEGHSRMTIYGMKLENFDGTYGFIGHCSNEDMITYDSRMAN